jgi:flavorubredoxin
MSTTVLELVPGRLYSLAHGLELDGRLTMFGAEERGHTVAHSYVFVEGDRALLVDTSYTVHEAGLLAALEEVLPAGTRLSLFPPRLGEFDGVCNTRPVVDRFDVQDMHCAQYNGTHWVDFRPEHRSPMRDVTEVVASAEHVVELGPGRELRAFHPVLRLLTTHWIYDEATRTMFTSDTFAHTWRDSPEGPWTTGGDEHAPEPRELLARMAAARFWWLPGARTAPLRDGLAETFAGREVEVLAPSYGCVVVGADAVAEHVRALDAALELA